MELEKNALELKKAKAYLEILGTAFAWGLSAVLLKMNIENVAPYHLLMGRFSVAAIFIFAMRPKSVKQINKEVLKAGVPLGVMVFIAYSFGVVCLKYTSASKSSFLVSLSVLFVPLLEIIIKRKIISKWTFVSIFLSVIGLRLISGMDGAGFNIGDTFAILSALFYSIYIIMMDRMGKDFDEIVLTFIQLFVVSVCSTIALFIFEDFNFESLMNIWPTIFLIGILCTGMSTLFQTRAQKVASTESVGILLLGEPLFTSILAFFILKETILASGLLGGALIIFSLVIAIIKKI
ncbi:MAG: DMT family transporter [Clostridiales bacterium]|nr:DMT family transporter [Clostridiales bacterium]